jgi:hypothetical protein
MTDVDDYISLVPQEEDVTEELRKLVKEKGSVAVVIEFLKVFAITLVGAVASVMAGDALLSEHLWQ